MKNLPPVLRINRKSLPSIRSPRSFRIEWPMTALLVVATALTAFAFLTPEKLNSVLAEGQSTASGSQTAHDPGVRTDAVDAGQPLANLAQTTGAPQFFNNGQQRFEEIEVVQGGANNGFGPRFNTNQCASCHAQPNVGGSSPSTSVYPFVGPNPETLVYNLDGAANTLPSFITAGGPVREARFVHFLNSNGSVSSTADGGVHDLFTIKGLSLIHI